MKKLIVSFAAVCCASLSFNVLAATNPGAVTYGSTTGDINVTIVKDEAMRVSNLDDVDFGTTHTAPTAGISDDVCMYSSSGAYFLTASSGSGTGVDFRMSDGGGNFIDYDVQWDDAAGSTSGTNMDHAVKSAASFANADTTDELCSGGVNASITVDVDAASFAAAPTGNYTDVLTLLFEAQ